MPMALNLGMTIFGASIAAGPTLNWGLMLVVLINAFLFLYTAHLNDTMWDVIKGEYEEERTLHAVRLNDTAYLPRLGFGLEVPGAPLLPRNHYLGGILLCSVLGTLIAWWLAGVVGWLYLPLALTGLALALTYSAGLDKIPAAGDTMWELGVIAALFCGFYSQTGILEPTIKQVAMVLFVALLGIKTLDGWYDVPTDTKIGKITLPVFLNSKLGVPLEPVRDLAYVLLYVTVAILLAQMPPPFYPGLVGGGALVAFSHLYYRGRDMEARRGIVFGAIGILILTSWNILVATGVVFF